MKHELFLYGSLAVLLFPSLASATPDVAKCPDPREGLANPAEVERAGTYIREVKRHLESARLLIKSAEVEQPPARCTLVDDALRYVNRAGQSRPDEQAAYCFSRTEFEQLHRQAADLKRQITERLLANSECPRGTMVSDGAPHTAPGSAVAQISAQDSKGERRSELDAKARTAVTPASGVPLGRGSLARGEPVVETCLPERRLATDLERFRGEISALESRARTASQREIQAAIMQLRRRIRAIGESPGAGCTPGVTAKAEGMLASIDRIPIPGVRGEASSHPAQPYVP